MCISVPSSSSGHSSSSGCCTVVVVLISCGDRCSSSRKTTITQQKGLKRKRGTKGKWEKKQKAGNKHTIQKSTLKRALILENN